MSRPIDRIALEHVDELRDALEAKAVGFWWVDTDCLKMMAFSASPRLAEGVPQSFVDATEFVPLDRTELGIVAAATTGTVVVSRAAELPAETGSGYWLRAFGAARSVAVPIVGTEGATCVVVSAALADGSDDDDVADRIRGLVKQWIPTL
jgi:hypothetical protein